MKRWRIWTLVSVALLVWGGAAAADLLYGTTNPNGATVGLILGKDYRVHKDLWGNLPQYAKVFSFKDHNGKSWAVVDEYSFSSAAPQDTVDIFDPETWDKPKQLTAWGRNLYGLTTAGKYLYIAAFDKREGAEEKSGEIIRVDMSREDFSPDKRHSFDPYIGEGEAILRHPCAVQVINDKIYVLTYTYDGVHSGNAQFGLSDVFEFDLDLNPLRQIPLGTGSREAKNAQRMQVFDGKLYVGTTGGAQIAGDASVGGVWEIDPSRDPSGPILSEKQLLDLNTVADPEFAGKEKGVLGFWIAKDGTVYLLVGGYDSVSKAYVSKLYITTAARLSKGEIGESVPSFPSVSGILYDEYTETLWAWTESWVSDGGGALHAYDKNANPLQTFTPADLGDNFYFLALLEAVTLPGSPADNGGSGGGCDAGLGVFALLLSAAVLMSRYDHYRCNHRRG